MFLLNSYNGFTYIETLTLVVILGVLAVFAYSGYSEYMLKARRSDAHIALMQLESALQSYYSEHNSFEGASLAQLNVSNQSPKGFYHLELKTSADDYTISAIPIHAQAADKHCGTLSLNAKGIKTASRSESHACW